MEPEKTPRERAEDLISLLVADWRPTRQHVLWAIRIVVALALVLGILTLVGRPFDITLWQWLDLLIIPAVLAIGGYLFTRSENRVSRVVAEQRAQDEALQAYLDQMGQMLLNEETPLHKPKANPLAIIVARARTLSVLTRVDGERKGSVLQFLYESALITPKDVSTVPLNGANLSGANFRLAVLPDADLRGVNLQEADLRGVQLQVANLRGANLQGADLSAGFVRSTRTPNYAMAFISSVANLSGANLRGVQLQGADLSNADLSNAKGISNEELERQAATLKGATMPNGQQYEDWIKDKEGRGKDVENE